MTRIHLASVLVVVAVLPATALQTPYKRVHQTALRKLLRGKVDEALDSLAKHPDLAKDPETLYLHACAEARRGNVEAAEASLDAALSAGLPAGRALAGTKTLLPGLADTALLKRLHERFAHVPVHGPMIGNVTPNSAMFWVRTARACDVEVVVASFDDPDNVPFLVGFVAKGLHQAMAEQIRKQPDTPFQIRSQGMSYAFAPRRHTARILHHMDGMQSLGEIFAQVRRETGDPELTDDVLRADFEPIYRKMAFAGNLMLRHKSLPPFPEPASTQPLKGGRR